MAALYDRIGRNYTAQRCTDRRLYEQLRVHLEGATRIVNIGAGSGSYEPPDIPLVAVEPSAEMISQRPPGAHPVEQAFAESLPFADDSFSHALTVLSIICDDRNEEELDIAVARSPSTKFVDFQTSQS